MKETTEKIDTEALLKKLPETDGLDKAKILADLTLAFRETNPEEAIEFGKQGLELLQNTQDKKLELTILNELCRGYHYLSKYQASLEYGFRALELSNAVNDNQCKATALNRIGVTYLNMALFDQALEYFVQALQIHESSGNISLHGNRSKLLYSFKDILNTLDECFEEPLILQQDALWLGHESIQTTEDYLRVDVTERIGVLESVTPPQLRPGKFRPPDRLIASLRG